jgi:hypothetical protein
MVAVASLVLASKLHGRTLTARRLIVPDLQSFSADDVAKLEFTICGALNWDLTPVTPYEIVKYVLLYSAADGKMLKNLLLRSQLFVDYALCDAATLKHSQAAVALSAVLHGHKAAGHPPKQWLEAIQEINLNPIEDTDVHACCYTMEHLYSCSGIGIPPKPTVTKQTLPPSPRQVSPASVTRFMFPDPDALSQNDQHKRASPDPAECEFGPVKFHAQGGYGDEYNPVHKRPRARSMSEEHARS